MWVLYPAEGRKRVCLFTKKVHKGYAGTFFFEKKTVFTKHFENGLGSCRPFFFYGTKVTKVIPVRCELSAMQCPLRTGWTRYEATTGRTSTTAEGKR
jgi:hypothetical protein